MDISKIKDELELEKVNYIISPCQFSSHGLSRILSNSKIISIESLSIKMSSRIDNSHRYIVFLPNEPALIISGLSFIAEALNTTRHKSKSMIIICPCPFHWLWYTLLNLVNEKIALSQIRVISSKASISFIDYFFNTSKILSYPTIEQYMNSFPFYKSKTNVGLTRSELNTLLYSLMGIKIKHQANFLNLSVKTIYHHNKSAINKLISHYPNFGVSFPGVKFKRSKNHVVSKKPNFNKFLISTLINRNIFFLYKLITNKKLQVQGVELLCRMEKDGEILTPDLFFAGSYSEHALLALTIYARNEAISKINLHPDNRFYFTTNLLTIILDDPKLSNIIISECTRLIRFEDISRLVFEIPEVAVIREYSVAKKNTLSLSDYGFKILLDVLFSQDSVFPPVKRVSFDGYKIGMGFLKGINSDANYLVLLKSLIYYCKLKGGYCIADGIESIEILNVLSDLDVDDFQGFYVSNHVNYDDLFYFTLK